MKDDEEIVYVKKHSKSKFKIIIMTILVLIIVFLAYSVISTEMKREKDFLSNKKDAYVLIKSTAFGNNKKMTATPNSQQYIDIYVENINDFEVKYSLWYKIVSGNSENIKVLYISDQDDDVSETRDLGPSGKKNSTETIKLLVTNNSTENASIQFGTFANKDNSGINAKDTHIITDKITSQNIFDTYYMGVEVKLLDGSEWIVAKDSSSTEEYISLFSKECIDYNEDLIHDENDYIHYVSDSNNVMEYLNTIYKNRLINNKIIIDEKSEIRLLKLEDLIAMGLLQADTYKYQVGSRISNTILVSKWWTMTHFSNETIYYIDNYEVKSNSEQVTAGIRPYLVIKKFNIAL